MTTNDFGAIDRAALAISGALMLFGVVVLGIFEVLAGQPYGAAPVTNDAGEIVANPAIDPNLRTGLFILGLVVLLLWGLYRMTAVRLEEETPRTVESTAD